MDCGIKNGFLAVSTILSVLVLVISPAAGYMMDGNKVAVDDSNVYMAQEPHTLHSSGWVNNILIPKQYTGNMDIFFGFDSSAARPVKAELYSPHEITETKSVTCDPPYWYNYTSTHFWCWYNETRVVSNNQTNETIGTEITAQLLFDHGYENIDLNTNTVYWTETKLVDYVNVADKFNKVNYDHNGKDTWYYAKNVPVQAGNEYNLRVYVKTQFNTAGKYDWCVKPSSESLAEAISTGHLYCLDPWWNRTGWEYSSDFNITNNNDSVTLEEGYTLTLAINHSSWVTAGKSNANGSDVRIVWGNSTSDTHSELDRINLTAWNTSTTTIAFKLQENISANGTDNNYSVYYGNALADTPPTNGSKVYFAWKDAENQDVSDWSCDANAFAQIDSNVFYAGSYSYKVNASSQWDDCWFTFPKLAKDMVFEWEGYSVGQGDGVTDGQAYMNLRADATVWGTIRTATRGDSNWGYAHPSWQTLETGLSGSTWYHWKAVTDVSANKYDFWFNGSLELDDETPEASITSGIDGMGFVAEATAKRELWMDNFLGRFYISPEPTASLFGGEKNQTQNITLENPAYTPGYGNVGGTFNFTVDVSNPEGDNVNATLFINDASIGSNTVSANGTASVLWTAPASGNHTYHWETVSTNVSSNITGRYPATGEAAGPAVTSPYVNGSQTYSPAYGNPNQLYTFNVTVNSTAGADVTPTVHVVDSNGSVQYSAAGTTVNDSNGTVYGTSTAAVNIMAAGSWRYFWNASINGVSVRYPVSGYLDGPEVANYYVRSINVPANLNKLTTTVTWTSVNASYVLSIRLFDSNETLTNQFDAGASTRTKVTETVIPLPGLNNYNITRYDGSTRMRITSPANGSWQMHVINSEISQFETDVEFS